MWISLLVLGLVGCESSGFFRNPYTDALEAESASWGRGTDNAVAAPIASRASSDAPVPACRIERGPVPEGAPALEITAIDVGQGDGLLLIGPSGKTMLIDGGNAFHPRSKPEDTDLYFGGRRRDMGLEAVLPYLQSRGIDSLDVVVGSHPHADHIGGLVAVVREIPVGRYVDPGVAYSSDTYATLLEELSARRITYQVAQVGDSLAWDPLVSCRVLGPDPGPDGNVNNSSVVLQVEYGGFRALLTGDAEHEAEQELLRSGLLRSACLLKVGHHGSRTSTSPGFLRVVQPQVAVISCGRRNKFHHPHPVTLKRLTQGRVELFRTDKHGRVSFLTDGNVLQVDVELHGGVPVSWAPDESMELAARAPAAGRIH